VVQPALSCATRALLTMTALFAAACGSDEMKLSNRLDELITIEVRAPKETLTGGCEQSFKTRFCADEYVPIGTLDISPREERTVAISDTIDDQHCTNVLWLRLLRLGSVGPVEDPGTLIQLPTDAEIEQGAGALHSVAFPQATVRIDEVGALDANQAQPPQTCAELGRAPR
jgi:hypothetical protein